MSIKTTCVLLFYVLGMLFNVSSSFCQQVEILSHSVNSKGQVQLEVNSTEQHYYILKVKHHEEDEFELTNSMTLGRPNTTIITEPLRYYPIEHYQVLEYPIATPFDSDGDGINDMAEYQNLPQQNPLNAAFPINIEDGMIMVNNLNAFQTLAVQHDVVQWSEFLNGKQFVKYIITDFNTKPKVFFLNSNQHYLHLNFSNAIGIENEGPDIRKGQIIYHPSVLSNNGSNGVFAFNYSNGRAQDFENVRRTHELLAANLPFIENNLSYYITDNNSAQYNLDAVLFQASRVSVLFEAEVYAGVDYLPLNQEEGFGFFRKMALEDVPGPRDIVLYESLPNELPRVGGIMTSVIQTPLSHVNLRAIQNNIPNAFIRDPLDIGAITNLLDKNIYYKVEQDNYLIREATLEEVNEWYEDLRPDEAQTPPLNLEYTEILELQEIAFTMSDGFGAKCSNLAAMRTFGFPDEALPNGFGVPFYFYQEFMAYNNFFDEMKVMLENEAFNTDAATRKDMLKDFRKRIKNADMPDWMMDELAAMHATFPEGTSIRCRSSSNNEDLPSFNGAGLYDSKTQHPDEGHISKSIKQVYASLWNLRAFEEREFYRIDHFISSMGVLCHPNFSDEKANGVGVTTDPLYHTTNTFYINTQLGEDLITNPDVNSIPEEILLYRGEYSGKGHLVIQNSNLVPIDSTLMADHHLDELRDYMNVIHEAFKKLYKEESNDNFAMDIEFKINSENLLVVKQARPWVKIHIEEPIDSNEFEIAMNIFPNPAKDYITVQFDYTQLSKIRISNSAGQRFQEIEMDNSNSIDISLEGLQNGIYILSGFDPVNRRIYSKKFVKAN